MTEKLTDELRRDLSHSEEGREALRIIDAQAAVIERVRVWLSAENIPHPWDIREALATAPDHAAPANARVAELELAVLDYANRADVANDRADAAERAKAEWERLRGEAYSLYRSEAEKRERAESEAAALRAEVERLRDGNTFLSRELGRAQEDADRERCERVQLEETDNQQLADAESRLSTATELLRYSLDGTGPYNDDQFGLAREAFLSTAPATTEREAELDNLEGLRCPACDRRVMCLDDCPRLKGTRTEAERAVLDAMTIVPLKLLEAVRDGDSCLDMALHPACRAELARREMKP